VPTTIHPSVQRVLAAAERKGVTLDVVAFDESTHTAAEAAAAVGAELGQIVKSLVFVIPSNGGRRIGRLLRSTVGSLIPFTSQGLRLPRSRVIVRGDARIGFVQNG